MLPAMLGGIVFLVLPLAVWVLYARTPERGWREACIVAALAWAAGIALVTEGLGLFGALRFGPVCVIWLGINSVLGWLGFQAWRRGTRISWRWLTSPAEWIMATVLGGLLGLTLAVALGAPPNTPDALSYHLPRQLMWLQQGGVSHFVTADDRALMMPPLSEMIQAHAMLLAGGDVWANFPQWLAYFLGGIVASLLARELGAVGRTQVLAALVFATLPMAYLEASSAKNDLLVAVWLAIFAWYTLRLLRPERAPLTDWLLAAAALGVGLETKTTAFIFGAVIGIGLLPAWVREPRRALLFPVIVLILAGPHWSRNFAWYGTPLGVHRAEDGGAQGNEIYTWRSTVSNAVRNLTLYLATPSDGLNRRLAGAVSRFHHWIGQDLNDPRTTLWVLKYDVTWWPQSEPSAGAPMQFLLAAGAVTSLLLRSRQRPEALQLFSMAAGGALLCCVLLKWQPWGARLHLPIFVLLAPLIACFAAELGAVVSAVVAIACVVGWWPSAEPDIRPWHTEPTIFATSRWRNYFRTHQFDQWSTEACLRAISIARVQSLQVVTKHGFPYPLMQRFLKEDAPHAELWGPLPEASAHPPDGVVLMEPLEHWLPLYVRLPNASERFRAIGATDPIGLYVPESRARELAENLPPPNFVGWNVAENLGPLEFQATGNRFTGIRRLTAPQVRLGFDREGTRMHVQIEALNSSTVVCEIELRLDGARVAAVRFEPDMTVQKVDVPLHPTLERAELVLLDTSGKPPPLHLIALRILD